MYYLADEAVAGNHLANCTSLSEFTEMNLRKLICSAYLKCSPRVLSILTFAAEYLGLICSI